MAYNYNELKLDAVAMDACLHAARSKEGDRKEEEENDVGVSSSCANRMLIHVLQTSWCMASVDVYRRAHACVLVALAHGARPELPYEACELSALARALVQGNKAYTPQAQHHWAQLYATLLSASPPSADAIARGQFALAAAYAADEDGVAPPPEITARKQPLEVLQAVFWHVAFGWSERMPAAQLILARLQTMLPHIAVAPPPSATTMRLLRQVLRWNTYYANERTLDAHVEIVRTLLRLVEGIDPLHLGEPSELLHPRIRQLLQEAFEAAVDERGRGRTLALLMATQPRLGADSRLRLLDPGILTGYLAPACRCLL